MTNPLPFTPELLDRCIACGFCLPSCPTYRLTGDETSSPRGRITLMRAVQTGELAIDDPQLYEQSSFCLGCRACETACPAGVEYGTLLEEWRDHAWRGRRRPLLARLLMLAVNRPWRVRAMGLPRRHARRRVAEPQAHLMLGCFERMLYPRASRAAQQLYPQLDADPGQGCCGALHAHNGELERGRQMARELGERLPGMIVTTAGGCAAHLAGVIGRDRVREISEWMLEHPPADWGELTHDGRRAQVAVQDSCHLRNGLGVSAPPRQVLAQIADVVELPSAGSCCGAAGSYSLLRPDDARRVLAPKLAEVAQLAPDFVATVNPGCQRQLQAGLRRHRSPARARYLVELVLAASRRSRS